MTAMAFVALASLGCSADGPDCNTAQVERIELLHVGPVLPAPNVVLDEHEIRHTVYSHDRSTVARTEAQAMPKKEWARIAAAACAGGREKTERSMGNTFVTVVRKDSVEPTTYDAAKDDPVRQLAVGLVERAFRVDLYDLEPGHGNVEPEPVP